VVSDEPRKKQFRRRFFSLCFSISKRLAAKVQKVVKNEIKGVVGRERLIAVLRLQSLPSLIH